MPRTSIIHILAAAASAAPAQGVGTAHLVWMNHLDVGYTNDISSVLNMSVTPNHLLCRVVRNPDGR